MGGGVGMFLCVISSRRKKNCFSFPTGGISLPVSGCLMEIQAGSVVTLVGPWVCVTTWCPFTGSFTLKNGPIGLATSTTGASHTTGAHAQGAKSHCFLTNRFIPHTMTVTEELHLLQKEILAFYLHNLTLFA